MTIFKRSHLFQTRILDIHVSFPGVYLLPTIMYKLGAIFCYTHERAKTGAWKSGYSTKGSAKCPNSMVNFVQHIFNLKVKFISKTLNVWYIYLHLVNFKVMNIIEHFGYFLEHFVWNFNKTMNWVYPLGTVTTRIITFLVTNTLKTSLSTLTGGVDPSLSHPGCGAGILISWFMK